MESTTEARTQPDVVHPVTITVETFLPINQAANPVPKNAEGCVFRITCSPFRGFSGLTIWLILAVSVRRSKLGTFLQKTPLSAPSFSYTIRVCTIGKLSSLADFNRTLVCSTALKILPPPKQSGSQNPFTKSTMSSAGLSPNPEEFPKPWLL